MKNRKLRNALISAGSAVLVGVLLLGVNAAMSDAPGYDPPGAGVSPVFSDLQVTGDVDAGKDISIGANLSVDGSISTSDGLGLSSLSIEDNVVTAGSLEVQGELRAVGDFINPDVGVGRGELPVELPVSIQDDLDVTGDLDVSGDLDVTGDVQLGAGSMFGSVYTITKTSPVTVQYLAASCYTGDILLNCSGWSTAGLKGSSAGKTICDIYSMSAVPAGNLSLKATCLDPEGIR